MFKSKKAIASLTAALLLCGVLAVNIEANVSPIDFIEALFGDFDGFADMWSVDDVSGQSPTDQSTGSFQTDASPTVTGVDYQTDAYVTDESLTPDDTTWQRLNWTVSHAATMDDLLNCSVWLYIESTHGAAYNTTAETGYDLILLSWTEATDTWTLDDQGSFTQWNVDNANSDDPGAASGLTQFEFSARFQISKGAYAATTDWNATVHVYDDDDDYDVSSESTLVTMENYFETSFDSATFSWGNGIVPDSTNNTHGSLQLTIYANAQWEITLSASNFTAGGEDDVDPEVNDIICWDDDGSEGGTSKWIRNTTAVMLGTWDDQARMSTEAGFTRDVYIFLNPGQLFAGGVTWEVIITATTQANT